jgi:hypothetical protein
MSGADKKDDPPPEMVPATRMGGPGDDKQAGVEHLAENRRLIVRRSLLASAVGGAVPLPVLDDYFAGRVRAGMLLKIAERRRVDLAPSSAELLGDPREGTAMRNATLTAATLLALKLAWRKFFALLAIGRRAEEMATSFQLGMLFDHYCAKLHVGAGVDRAQAMMLRETIFGALAESERAAFVTAFREGGKVLGRSLLEAPDWVGERVNRAAQRWAESGGQSADPGDGDDDGSGNGSQNATAEARWVDRAAAAVESRFGRAEHGYLTRLVQVFERRWRAAEERRAAAANASTSPGPSEGP